MNKAAQLASPNPGNQKCLIAGCLLEIGEVKSALIFSDQAIGSDPTNGSYLGTHAALLLLTNDIDGAMAETVRAIKSSWQKSPSDFYELKPESPYIDRGWGHILGGDYESAGLDFEQAVKLNPEDPSCYGGGAIAAALKGDKNKAQQISGKGLEQCSDKSSLVCWYMLCGGIVSGDLKDDLLQYSPELWPYPLVRFYLGNMSAEEVIQRARGPGIDIGGQRLCEAYFSIGAKLLADGQPEKAKGYFVSAAQTGTAFWPDRQLAQKQLRDNCLAPLLPVSKSNSP